jgi:hypothetical protein
MAAIFASSVADANMLRCRSLMSAKRANPDGEKVNPHPAAHYIAERTRELAVLAHYDGCEDLAYMLELATIEAENMGGAPEGCSVS